MKITKEKLIELNACKPSIPWFESNGSEDLLTTLLAVNKHKPDWARWLFSRLMNKRQRTEISVFCAEKVIGLFEAKYPNDQRPRSAIEAAKKWLADPNEENRMAAADAAYAAAAAAAYYAAAAAANADFRLKLQEEIIHEAVRILDRDAEGGSGGVEAVGPIREG